MSIHQAFGRSFQRLLTPAWLTLGALGSAAVPVASVAQSTPASASAAALASRGTAATRDPRPIARAVDAVGFTVSNMDRAIEFYSTVLTFEKLSDVEVAGDAYERLEGVFGARARIVRMRLGDEQIELTEYLAPRGRPIPVDSRSQDRWFQHIAIIVSDMDSAYARLRAHKVQHASTGPQRLPDWNPNAGGIEAFYFKDPDGHTLEILEFPRGKGLAKWHRPATKLFLGIDHTAIVSGSMDASLAFYRDVLGMAVAGESENYGPEQEHLNSVFGARLRITALRAASGPGVELLEYLAPTDGRPYPGDGRANDLFHWQTIISAPDALAAERTLRSARVRFVSPGSVALGDTARSVLIRDPDGHAVLLSARR
jgi:catechol 2,3-dioxygenase-like lactoylglutathione lyase family enzyme